MNDGYRHIFSMLEICNKCNKFFLSTSIYNIPPHRQFTLELFPPLHPRLSTFRRFSNPPTYLLSHFFQHPPFIVTHFLFRIGDYWWCGPSKRKPLCQCKLKNLKNMNGVGFCIRQALSVVIPELAMKMVRA